MLKFRYCFENAFLNISEVHLKLNSTGTRFRPLSLNIPKPLFPLAGQPMVHHPISACKKVYSGNDFCHLWFVVCLVVQNLCSYYRFLTWGKSFSLVSMRSVS